MAMKKIIVTRQGVGLAVALVGITMVVLLAANLVQAEGCEIVNGSFEDDGIIADITAGEPNGWDVNVPAGKFVGYVRRDWPTEGGFNLTLYAESFASFNPNDMVIVLQDVNLTDANEVIFDIRMKLLSGMAWDPEKASAIVLIDDEVVWDSNELSSGEYLNQVYAVENKYRDGMPHTLSFGMRVNASGYLWQRYITDWDYIECTEFCGGGGLLAGDFNRDCFVDTNDLKLMADVWLDEPAVYDRGNLFHGDDVEGDGGIVSFGDFAVLAGNWDGDWDGLRTSITDIWLNPVGLDDENNLFHGDDVQPSGIINFLDFAVFAENWLGSSYE